MGRTFQHVRLLPHHERAGERRHRRPPARRARACCPPAHAWSAPRRRACSPRPRARSSASAWASTCSTRPAACRSASSASSRSPAPCAPIPAAAARRAGRRLRYLEKQALAELLRKLRGEGMGILLVEHDMDFVMGLADRVVVMEFGEKIAEGLPRGSPEGSGVLEAYLGGVSDERIRFCSKSATCASPTARSRPCTTSIRKVEAGRSSP
jgi:hypothetical protein